MEGTNKEIDQSSRWFSVLFFPLMFVISLWIVFLYAGLHNLSQYRWGVLPRHIEGLKGVVFMPFIHADLDHLVNNSVPLLVLGLILFYFYKAVAYRVFFLNILFSGFWVWLGGREAYHIGASGVVYGLASFIFVSGVIRRHTGMAALSLLVVFLYGSMIWGIFPTLPDISWEGHLLGSLSGLILAVFYRNKGPVKPVYSWEEEEGIQIQDPVNPEEEKEIRDPEREEERGKGQGSYGVD